MSVFKTLFNVLLMLSGAQIASAASVVTAGLGSYPSVYYDRKGIAALEKTLFLYPAIDQKQMPDRSGVAMQIFDYSAMAANTTPATDGTPSTGQTLTQNVKTITLSQYVDYVSFSDKVVLTAISDTITEGAERLSYRGALTVDNLINTKVDSIANGTAAATIDVNDGSYMTAALSRRCAQSLQSVDVKPKDSGLYYGVIHSLAAFDLINDSSAGGFIDIQKYTSREKLEMGVQSNFVGNVGGVAWYQSNALTTFAGWQSTSHIAYEAVVIGKDAVFGSSLGKTKLNQKNFGVRVARFNPGDNSLDPAGLIAAAASYNFWFGVSERPGSTPGLRRVRVESSIG